MLEKCDGFAGVPSAVEFGGVRAGGLALRKWMHLLHAVVLRHSKGCRASSRADCLAVSGGQAEDGSELTGCGSDELACCLDRCALSKTQGQGSTSNSSLAGPFVYAMHQNGTCGAPDRPTACCEPQLGRQELPQATWLSCVSMPQGRVIMACPAAGVPCGQQEHQVSGLPEAAGRQQAAEGRG